MKKYPRVVAFRRFSRLSFTSLVPTWGITSALNQSFSDNRTRSTFNFSSLHSKNRRILWTFHFFRTNYNFLMLCSQKHSHEFIRFYHQNRTSSIFAPVLVIFISCRHSAATTSCVHFRLLWPSDFKTHNNLIYIQIYFPPCFDNFSSLSFYDWQIFINIYNFTIFLLIESLMNFYSCASFKCEYFFSFFSSTKLRPRGTRNNVYRCRQNLLNWTAKASRRNVVWIFPKETSYRRLFSRREQKV